MYPSSVPEYTRTKLIRVCLVPALFIGITWGKVVSLYAVAGALAVDCVQQGQPATVHTIVDSLGQFVRKFLAPWLKKRGGWVRTCCF